MTIDEKHRLVELMALAKKATRGDWIAVGRCVENAIDALPDICSTIGRAAHIDADRKQCADAAYIAAANPKMVMWMISCIAELEAQLYTAPQPAAQAPALRPLAKRAIGDAIRGAYDLGYNDRAMAHRSYDGQKVEADHASALIHRLGQLTDPAGQEAPQDAWLRGHIAGLEKARDVCRIVGDQETSFEATDCADAIHEQQSMVTRADYTPPRATNKKEPS